MGAYMLLPKGYDVITYKAENAQITQATLKANIISPPPNNMSPPRVFGKDWLVVPSHIFVDSLLNLGFGLVLSSMLCVGSVRITSGRAQGRPQAA
jgi:hypothetical protein